MSVLHLVQPDPDRNAGMSRAEMVQADYDLFRWEAEETAILIARSPAAGRAYLSSLTERTTK